MTYKTNITNLRWHKKNAPKSNQSKIDKIMQLCGEDITNYKTALNVVVKLSSPSLFEKGGADKDHVNTVSKYTHTTTTKAI